jgi:translation initiation factor 1 (eIF-1/SUI1)
MKNPNSPWNRLKANLAARWKAADIPGMEPRFQLSRFGRDVATFVILPIFAVFVSKALSAEGSQKKGKNQDGRKVTIQEPSHSQVIEFLKPKGIGRVGSVVGKRAPGTLVRLRLLNQVEAYSSTPVHAQILDEGLGGRFRGGVLIGDGASDAGFQRINVTFRVARDPNSQGIAFPVAARALSLDGTLGIAALKKEGMFARSVYGSAVAGKEDSQGAIDNLDLKSIVIKALSAGLLQEFGAGAQVVKNRSQVLMLKAGTDFFAELTDYFPSEGK